MAHSSGLALDDYARYGRQMILDRFGLPGQPTIPRFLRPCIHLRPSTRATQITQGLRCRSRCRRSWMSRTSVE
ncbi:hypothetical protein BDQ12DRAFT_680339 [Crucibulum laeve]|uniref:Uncharacterized protein n=1 Tax=Crucibulum laeve TaxID=68775 RepID=A0A5C3M6T5_9AGAR|nr:hypothetical protein BDQ12DRAFT_680339 [Crucibulum laeve]